MATPPSLREPKTHQEFAKLMGVTTTNLAHFEMEKGFEKAVLTCKMPMLRQVPKIVDAVFRNATDHSRPDDKQKMWMEFYLRLAGVDVGGSGEVEI